MQEPERKIYRIKSWLVMPMGNPFKRTASEAMNFLVTMYVFMGQLRVIGPVERAFVYIMPIVGILTGFR